MRSVVATAFLAVLAGCATSTPNDPASADPTVEVPPAAGVADYQLGGAYVPGDDVEIVIRDRSDDPVDGRYSICYVNAFQTQPDTRDWWSQHHDGALLRDDAGELVEDPDWPGEYLFDLSTRQSRDEVAAVVLAWFDQCAADGFQAVEPDNLDSFTRSDGALDRADTEAFARLLIDHAHRAGLAIAQKNTSEIDGEALGFDFAVAEECQVYDECGRYAQMYGDHVIEIEYTDNGREAFAEACRTASGDRSILLRDRDVVPAGDPAYVFEHC